MALAAALALATFPPTGALARQADGILPAEAAPPARPGEAGGCLRLAVFHLDLWRKGPGLLLRDLGRPPFPEDLALVLALIRQADADVILLHGLDHDLDGATLTAFNRALGDGAGYPHQFAARPNTGRATGLDMDGDGRAGTARDAQGYGRYAGEGGMAVLSRLPIGPVTDLSSLLWRDLPGARLPQYPDGSPFPSEAAQAVQLLSTTAHWDLPVEPAPGQWLHLLAWHATPPAFDGPEDRNGLRAVDELNLWQAYLAGRLAWTPPGGRDVLGRVLIGTANLDPLAGDGDRAAIASVLQDPRWQDAPGLVGQPTGHWPAPLGPLRLSYILPEAGLALCGGGVLPEDPAARPRRRLVWLDLELDLAPASPARQGQ